jgi:hypothetical protein
VLDVFESFVVDELVDLIAGGVGFGVLVGLVLMDSVGEIVGYAGVEFLEAAGEDVDVVGLGHWALMSVIATATARARTNAGVLRFAQNDRGFRVDFIEDKQRQVQKRIGVLPHSTWLRVRMTNF